MFISYGGIRSFTDVKVAMSPTTSIVFKTLEVLVAKC